MIRRFVLAILCVVVGTVAGQAATVDILITGGTVLTMAGPNIEDGAVAIDFLQIGVDALGKAGESFHLDQVLWGARRCCLHAQHGFAGAG